jgi:hypothetical protein
LRVRLPSQEQKGRDEETLNMMRTDGKSAFVKSLEKPFFNNSSQNEMWSYPFRASELADF